MQSLIILIAPALMAASIYMILGRIILLTKGEHLSAIKQRWLTKIFVTGDVISLLLQGSGTYSYRLRLTFGPQISNFTFFSLSQAVV